MRISRWFHLSITGCVLAIIGIASLSDSVRGSGARGLVEFVHTGATIIPGYRFGIDVLAGLPFDGDTIGHFVAWTMVGIVAAGLVDGVVERLNVLLSLFALSALIEVGQRHLSSSRSAEVTDLMANGVGLAVGFCCFWAAEQAVRTIAPMLNVRSADRLERHLQSL